MFRVNVLSIVCVVVGLGGAGSSVSAEDLVKPGAKLRKLADGFRFTEGPAVASNGDVYFSDIPDSRIHKWDVAAGECSTFRKDSGGANGLFFSKDGGTLYICEGGRRRVAKVDMKTGKHAVLAAAYDGNKLNKPNDLWPDGQGGLYFTDPAYGLKKDDLEQGGEHVYYVDFKFGKVTRAADGFTRPNGIVGTADGKTLYISDRTGGKTYAYPIEGPGRLGERRLFCEEGSDGVTLDQHGNLYITPRAPAVHVYSPAGKLIAKIETPKPPSNVVFGGKDRTTLYITSRDAFYGIDMNVRGQ